MRVQIMNYESMNMDFRMIFPRGNYFLAASTKAIASPTVPIFSASSSAILISNSFSNFMMMSTVSRESAPQVSEGCFGFNGGFVHAESVDDDSFYAICNFRHSD